LFASKGIPFTNAGGTFRRRRTVTKIYTYCLFDGSGTFYGVYSSLKAIHRDALKLANKGPLEITVNIGGIEQKPTIKLLWNTFKGVCDVQVEYRCGSHTAKIIKTRLKE
jgi:hypothetical protein